MTRFCKYAAYYTLACDFCWFGADNALSLYTSGHPLIGAAGLTATLLLTIAVIGITFDGV